MGGLFQRDGLGFNTITCCRIINVNIKMRPACMSCRFRNFHSSIIANILIDINVSVTMNDGRLTIATAVDLTNTGKRLHVDRRTVLT